MAELPGTSPLEEELRELGRALAVGPTPDVRAAVRSALEQPGQPRPRARSRSPLRRFGPARGRLAAVAVAAVVLVGGVLTVSPAARAAAVRLLSFAGIELRDEPPPAARGTGALPSQRPLSLVEARRAAKFPVTAPAELGQPERVTVSDGGRVVTLTYAAAAGRPALRVDQSGDGLELLFQKFVDPSLAESVQVGGGRGLWVRTAHDVAYVDGSGNVRPETVRLSAATLVWTVGAVTVRLEGARTLPEALALAAAFR